MAKYEPIYIGSPYCFSVSKENGEEIEPGTIEVRFRNKTTREYFVAEEVTNNESSVVFVLNTENIIPGPHVVEIIELDSEGNAVSVIQVINETINALSCTMSEGYTQNS